MKKHLLIMWSLLLCFATGAWAADGVSTLTFEDKCGGSGTANDGVKWTITSDGNESNYDANRGIHYGTSSAAVQYIRLTTSDITYPIKKIVVNASTANGVSATVSVTVGGEAFGGDAQTLTSDAADYEFTGSASGVIVVNVTKPASAKKALYVKSVAVTYEVPAGTPMAPTISGKDPFVGSTSVTITNNEDGATVYYTTDESDPTTSTTAQEYTAAFDISATTTVKAAAKKGDKWSAVASKIFTAIPSVANIAELTALGDEATFNFTGEALIVAQPSATNTYVKDNTGSTLIYGGGMVAENSVGKTIAAGWTGKVDFYNGLFEAKPDAALTLKEGEAVTVKYDEASIADLTLANINKVVVLKGVTYTLGTGKNFTINMEGAEVTGYNQFNLTIEAAEDGKTYDIVGAISRHNDDIQFQPISITKTPELVSYEIKIVNTDGLTITPDVTTAKAGDKVYASYVLADHYQLEFPDFVDDDGQPIEFTEGVTAGLEEVGGEMKMWFIMPEKNVTIKAKATKLYQLSMTQPENGTITVISVNMGSDPYSKAGKTICMMVTANEGYVIKSVEVKDANDAAVAVSAESGFEYGQAYNYVFTMPASDVKIGATIQKEPEDININPETGADISQALATASEGKNVRNITINLNAGEYTMSAPIVAGGNVTINGAAGATIDASTLTGPFIQMSSTPGVEANALGAYPIDGITIKDVKINNVKSGLVEGKNAIYYMKAITIENSVINVSGNKHIIDFQGKGLAEVLSIKNSTLWASDDAKHTGRLYQQQSGKKPSEVGATQLKVSIESSTLYNICNGNNYVGYYRENSKSYHSFEVLNSVIVNCATSGNFVAGLNQKQKGAASTWNVSGNIFNFGGADTSADEVNNSATGVVQNNVAGVVTFTDAPQGDFNGVVELPYGATEPTSLGDGRWTLSYTHAPVEHTYIVAGSNSEIFGTSWDQTNESNKMTNNGDGTYSKTYTVSEAVNDIQLKVVEDGMNWYGDAEGNNVVFDLSAAGSFTVNFDSATGIVTVTGDIVTGINAISADKAAENLENAEIYTLNGQRVEKPRKGLYIVNGKKVVIK